MRRILYDRAIATEDAWMAALEAEYGHRRYRYDARAVATDTLRTLHREWLDANNAWCLYLTGGRESFTPADGCSQD